MTLLYFSWVGLVTRRLRLLSLGSSRVGRLAGVLCERCYVFPLCEELKRLHKERPRGRLSIPRAHSAFICPFFCLLHRPRSFSSRNGRQFFSLSRRTTDVIRPTDAASLGWLNDLGFGRSIVGRRKMSACAFVVVSRRYLPGRPDPHHVSSASTRYLQLARSARAQSRRFGVGVGPGLVTSGSTVFSFYVGHPFEQHNDDRP